MRALIVLAALLHQATALGAPPPLEDFARLPRLRSVGISPDGARLVYIAAFRKGELQGADDNEIVQVTTLGPKPVTKALLASKPGVYDISWCSWANNERVLCGLRAAANEYGFKYPISRLVSISADGSAQKVLMQNNAQFHDRILDWTAEQPDTVLIELDEDRNGFPSVYEMNIYTGRRRERSPERAPIRAHTTDAQGAVRLGFGFGQSQTEIEYYARLENEREWRRLAKIKAFTDSDALEPIAIKPGVANRAYAIGAYEGRQALWEIDLTDKTEPELLFSHPLVDAASPHFAAGGRLLGVYYETDRPFIYYTDARAHVLIEGVNRLLPGKFNIISDMSRDEKKLIIRSTSDIDDGSYYLYDSSANALVSIGAGYPELANAALGRMRSITYPARDGVEIPGYLTTPPGLRAEGLPLIVMPHGGPISRDTWSFFFLREFLVSRGYAVLQMNFRGSSGYGGKWFRDAHQDWGGLTYSDIIDGARWAIARGVADPKRVCIVGWSFGGYAALLGAVRDGDLYRCAVSIAGVSDLHLLLQQQRQWVNWRFAREQIGVDAEKLNRDSPLRHIEAIKIPLLLVHGDKDFQVDVEHSRKMVSAFKRADKPHRAVFLQDGDHQLWRMSHRIALLTEVEKFLLEHLGPGATPPSQ